MLSLHLLCAVPSEPQDLRVVNIFHVSLRITWHPPARPNGIITQYRVSFFDSVVLYFYDYAYAPPFFPFYPLSLPFPFLSPHPLPSLHFSSLIHSFHA